MAVPNDLLWNRDPHTAAKHALLKRYLMAWFPIMASQYRDVGITFLDGFAGPGKYLNSSESSPVIAMSQAARDDVVQYRTVTRLVFIEDRKDRAEHLQQLLDDQFPGQHRPTNIRTLVRHGKCHEHYATDIAQLGGWDGPVFANLDGWGVDTHYDVVCRIAKQRSSEVLVTFNDQFLTRFAEVEEQQAGDRVYGNRDWRNVANEATPNKKPFLLSLYRERLKLAGFTHILTFEMIDEGGHSLYLFFATTSVTAVEKFKDGLWEVDAVAGQRFRDPRNRNQLSFDMDHPDFSALDNEILRVLAKGPADLEHLSAHALLETIYKKSHAKPAVDRLVERRLVIQARKGQAYKDRVFELAPAALF